MWHRRRRNHAFFPHKNEFSLQFCLFFIFCFLPLMNIRSETDLYPEYHLTPNAAKVINRTLSISQSNFLSQTASIPSRTVFSRPLSPRTWLLGLQKFSFLPVLSVIDAIPFQHTSQLFYRTAVSMFCNFVKPLLMLRSILSCYTHRWHVSPQGHCEDIAGIHASFTFVMHLRWCMA